MSQNFPKLVLLRHGQSEWNKNNLFTGWVDIPLSPKGIEEALQAGREIAHIPFDVIFISKLMRASLTAMLAMSVHESGKIPRLLHEGEEKMGEWGKIYSEASEATTIPVLSSWHLNERMYGELQGCNKDEMRAKFGEKQVKIWRRSYDVPPPGGESLKICAERTLPYFQEKVLPYLKKGKNVLISAHGNSLRSIVMQLDSLSEKEVLELEIPTGHPLIYEYRNGDWIKT
ncbi:MAG: 2,3-bisphosphoglycerate-dependent phosphoglycerate mutase [Candidatus Algichlamydia australiensis]|nr:2,3-bisphosphoglycerate-dependent phosphoglycerate mutase [Chlamydiales bacterium]